MRYLLVPLVGLTALLWCYMWLMNDLSAWYTVASLKMMLHRVDLRFFLQGWEP